MVTSTEKLLNGIQKVTEMTRHGVTNTKKQEIHRQEQKYEINS